MTETFTENLRRPLYELDIKAAEGIADCYKRLADKMRLRMDAHALAYRHYNDTGQNEMRDMHSEEHKAATDDRTEYETRLRVYSEYLRYLRDGGEVNNPFWDE